MMCTTLIGRIWCSTLRSSRTISPGQNVHHGRHRTFSCTSKLEVRHAPGSTGFVRLPDRSLIYVSGDDAQKFLHGLLTSSVPPVRTSSTPPSTSDPVKSKRGGFYSTFLEARGRVLFDVFVYPMPGNALYNVCGTARNHPGNKQEIPKEDGYAIEVDTSETHSLLKHLGRHKLRSKIEMRKLDLFCVYALWNDEVKDWTPPGLDPETEGLDGTILTDNRAPGLGKRSLFHIHAREKKYPPFEGLEKAYKRQYKLRRHRLAVPEGQLEIPSRTALPMNYNMDLMGAIDFKKGCYVGQELTIRTHHTGVTRKRVLPVQVYDPDHDPPVEWSWSDRWRYECPVAGTKFSMEGHPGSPGMWIDGLKNTGLALCNLREMTDLRIDEEPSPPDKETKIFTSVKGSKDILGVKAFVPEWLRDKIRPAKVQKRVG